MSREQSDTFLDEIRQEIAELDRLVEEEGWVSVDYPYGYKTAELVADIVNWCHTYAGEYKKFGRTYFFKNPSDATAFLLRWS